MRIFSGIQPSGTLHIGNYLGAMKNWVKLQEEGEAFFSVVDYHAITVDYNPQELKQKIISCVKDILAIGIDPKKATIFRQSDISEHTELAWILNTITNMGELNRMTQYKEKTQKNGERVGLFDYPVLMTADILLYKAEKVPVGEDQIQHLELARDLAQRFNARFGQTFPKPEAILTHVKKILSLTSEAKMSKSDSPSSYIALSDSPEEINKKISSATTDDGKSSEISKNTLNLINLYGEMTNEQEKEKILELRKSGQIKYAKFKPLLSEAIIKELELFQKRRLEITDEEAKNVLKEGAEKIRPIAQETIREVKEKMGLLI